VAGALRCAAGESLIRTNGWVEPALWRTAEASGHLGGLPARKRADVAEHGWRTDTDTIRLDPRRGLEFTDECHARGTGPSMIARRPHQRKADHVSIIYDSLYINGAWATPSSTDTISVVSPSTEQVIGRVPQAASEDVDAAVAAARRAFDDPTGWSAWDVGRRADVLDRFAEAYQARQEEFAQRVSAQNGMPISTSRQIETAYPSALLQYYGGLVRQSEAEERRQGLFGVTAVVRREPVGVVAAVTPWNFPQTLLFFKLAPALAAGCTVVIKPSPETVLDTFLLAEVLDQVGLPPGVVNVVPGGRELGAYLVSHPGVDKVGFTGSTRAGRSIAEVCGRLLRPVTLELGGQVGRDRPGRRRSRRPRRRALRLHDAEQRSDVLPRHAHPRPAEPLRRGGRIHHGHGPQRGRR
jgi:NAD-dependent aldehyde dehydrogenases